MIRPSRTSRLGVVLTAEQKAAVLAAANEQGKTMSTYASDVLSRHLIRTGRVPDNRRTRAQEEPQGDAA